MFQLFNRFIKGALIILIIFGLIGTGPITYSNGFVELYGKNIPDVSNAIQITVSPNDFYTITINRNSLPDDVARNFVQFTIPWYEYHEINLNDTNRFYGPAPMRKGAIGSFGVSESSYWKYHALVVLYNSSSQAIGYSEIVVDYKNKGDLDVYLYRDKNKTSLLKSKFSSNEVFDVARFPIFPTRDERITLTRNSYYMFDANHQTPYYPLDWGANQDRYIKFVPSSIKSSTFPSAYSLALNLYEANGKYVKTISRYGTLWDTRDDGFLYLAQDLYGYYFPKSAWVYSVSTSFTYLSSGLVTKRSEVDNYFPKIATMNANPSEQKEAEDETYYEVVSVEASVPNLTLEPDESKSIEVSAILSDRTRKDITLDATYFSYNSEVAAVSKGTINGVTEGSAKIAINFKGVETTINVAVKKPVEPKLLKIEPALRTITLKAGQQTELFVTATYDDGSKRDVIGELNWSLSKPGIADISDGLLTANKIGATFINARLEDKSIQIKVNVNKAVPIKTLQVSKPKVTIYKGQSQSIKITAIYADKSKEDVTNKVIWRVKDNDVVFLNSGKLSGLNKGKTTIAASFGGKSSSIQVEIK